MNEIQDYISFQLSQLNSKNQHHQFEDLCRQFARLRLVENILPATGPVSSGGDQGRDFESYRTYLSSSPIAGSLFLSKISTGIIVFACSLNKQFESKIKDDLITIFKDAPPIEAVYFFCNQTIPVSKRHELEKLATTNYKTNLIIFDLYALAENLANIDVFWIAQKYLNIPSTMFPRNSESSNTYTTYKKFWLGIDTSPQTHSDFFQIQYGIREATFNPNERSDLLEWIAKMELFTKGDNQLSRKALYEIAVASLRGLNNLPPYQERITHYFSEIEKLSAIDEIEDCVNLLLYCTTANKLGHSDFDIELIGSWIKSLINHIESILKNNKSNPNFRAYLLMLRGQLEFLNILKVTDKKKLLVNILKWWDRTIAEAKKAPLFPVLKFTKLVNLLIPQFGEYIEFRNFIQKLDKMVESRSSMDAVATNCQNRASAYYDSGYYIQAIKELHYSKINWFSAETLEESIHAILTIANCYFELKLIYAAKYYTLAATHIILDNNEAHIKKMTSKSLFGTALCCYQAGDWFTFMQIAKLAISAYAHFNDNRIDSEDELLLVLICALEIKNTAQKHYPGLIDEIDKLLLELPVEQQMWENLKCDYNEKDQEKKLLGIPFGDISNTKAISWKALGISWYLSFKNDYSLCAIAENIAAVLQVILADMADLDLCLLPTSVKLETFISNLDFSVKEKPSNHETGFIVNFPKINEHSNNSQEIENKILGLALFILNKCSALPEHEFLKIIDKAMKNGLSDKTFLGMPYYDCFKQLLSEQEFPTIKYPTFKIDSEVILDIEEASEISWNQDLGRGYSKQKANKFLKDRYKKTIKPIRLTLKKALNVDAFNQQVAELRKQGLLDWQILLFIMNIVISYRINQKGLKAEEMNTIETELVLHEEQVDDVTIPIDLLIEKMKDPDLQYMTYPATMKGWGLQVKQSTPDFKAIKRLLDVKYRNSIDDITHEDYLSP